MKQLIAVTALLFLAAADPRQPLVGHWTGTSLCTPVRPACHDEKASYWMTAGKAPDIVTIDAGKLVNGKDESMGILDFHADFAAHTLTNVMEGGGERWIWSFTWSGTEMTGTLKSEAGQVIRNIRLTKVK